MKQTTFQAAHDTEENMDTTCIVCNCDLDGPMWGAELHLECADALLEFILSCRTSGNSYVKGVIEVLFTGTREKLMLEQLAANCIN